MTPEALSKLTPEEKRVRIAEICGYKRTALSDTLCIWTSPTGEKSDTGYDPWNGQLFLPNYMGSLDAMATALDTMNSAQTLAWLSALQGIVQANYGLGCARAKATEQGDAFLLVMG